MGEYNSYFLDTCLDESSRGNSNLGDIFQCDGADSVLSSTSPTRQNRTVEEQEEEQELQEQEEEQEEQGGDLIPVMISKARTHQATQRDAPTVRKNISTNSKIQASATLPVVAVANVRSILPKLNSLIEKIENEEIDVSLVVEVWEKMGKKNRHFQSKVEEIMEMKGLKYISCGARPSGKRGGGAAILVNTEKFSLEKLDINIPHNLEVQWGLVRPKKITPSTKYREMIFCCFYSPPSSRKHRKLLDHLVSATHAMMARYPQAAVYLGADKNSLPLAPLLLALPRFRQVVAHSTHGGKILDVLIMSCPDLYSVPEVTPPVLPDNPLQAKPSDHRVPVARPLACTTDPVSNVYTERTYRPLPDSLVREFLKWIHEESWDSLPETASPTEVVEEYEKLVQGKVEELFPERKVRMTGKDKPFITAEIKTLNRRKMKEFRKHGKSARYLKITKDFQVKYKSAASNYLKKCVSDLKREQPGKAAATLKRMGAQPGDCQDGGSFTLLNHIKENLTVEEQIERFSDFFVAVSQEFPPLELSQLSNSTRQKISNIRPQDIPVVEEHEIYQILSKTKRKKSSVPGDIPPSLFYESSAGLAKPAARIMNRIAQTGFWPEQFSIEWGVPLEKSKPAEDESQTRLLSCSNKMNLVLEKQVVFWLMQCVKQKLDPDQFGGVKGNSISHYLIEMTNFILYNQDMKDPVSTIGVYLDYKQGFNRCQHSIFIEILANDYDVPGWLLRILIGYLTRRKLRVRYKQKVGKERDIPGGGGQGVPIGMWIFCFMVDKAGPPPLPRPLGQIITAPLNKRKPLEKTKKKWIDDFTILGAINLKKTLVPDHDPIRPVSYHNRTEHHLLEEDNFLQMELEDIARYSQDRKMILHPGKTNAMIFITRMKYDLHPVLSIQLDCQREVVEEDKILG